jgi:hypothetical protein
MAQRIKITILLILLCIPLLTLARDNKYHRIGRFWERMEDSGVGSDAIWPAGWGYQENAVDIGHWVAVKNFTDKDGTYYSHYVAEGGTYISDENEYNMPLHIKRFRRYPAPMVVVDGEEVGEKWEESALDFVDPDLPCEEMIESKWRTGTGMTVTRRSYAVSQKNHYDYIILDYTLVNTGQMDLVEGVDREQTLEGVYFVIQGEFRPGRAGEDYYPVHSISRDDWAEFYGSEPGDSAKCLYMFDGKSLQHGGEQYDPRQSDGYLMAPQYIGFGVLHVDKSPSDQTHWQEMPASVRWESYVGTPSHSGGSTDQDMYTYISEGKIQRKSMDYDPTTLASKHVAMSFGPYTVAFGDSIRIVLVEAVGGISQALCQSVGAQWKSGAISEEEKNQIAGTGADSLFREVNLAKWAMENDYRIPEAPPSPDLTVESGPGMVTLQWSDVSNVPDPHTGAEDFAGYRVYRAEGQEDSLFTMIYECGGSSGNPVVHEYVDENVRRGFAYYYYVTAYDDGTQNTWGLYPGESLESSMFTNRTVQAAHPVRKAESVVDNVTVVPNPYNINSINLFPGERDKILFVNLPPKGTIRIFTLSGDLIKTIEHSSGTGDESWNLVTDSNQIIRSGLYIFHVEGQDNNGNDMGTVTGKFSVVR